MFSSIKCLLHDIKHKGEYRFAIRKHIVGRNTFLYPMCKRPGIYSKWIPIVKVYDKFLLMEYYTDGGLSKEQCTQHIEYFKTQLQNRAMEVRDMIQDEELEESANIQYSRALSNEFYQYATI